MILGHTAELLRFTGSKPSWFMMTEPLKCNKGALEIAKSVITGNFLQSYVAKDYPHWLKKVFDEEKVN